jgi:hypothetical protein
MYNFQAVSKGAEFRTCVSSEVRWYALCVTTLKIVENKPFAVTVKLLHIVPYGLQTWSLMWVFYVMFQLKNEVKNLLRELAFFLDLTLYTRGVEVWHNFGKVYCFHLQG